LAKVTETHGRSLARLLRVLVAWGLVEELEARRLKLTTLGTLLRMDVPGSLRDLALMVWYHIEHHSDRLQSHQANSAGGVREMFFPTPCPARPSRGSQPATPSGGERIFHEMPVSASATDVIIRKKSVIKSNIEG
jgi:hypothetical protein